jgi:hypothetical protein
MPPNASPALSPGIARVMLGLLPALPTVCALGGTVLLVVRVAKHLVARVTVDVHRALRGVAGTSRPDRDRG